MAQPTTRDCSTGPLNMAGVAFCTDCQGIALPGGDLFGAGRYGIVETSTVYCPLCRYDYRLDAVLHATCNHDL